MVLLVVRLGEWGDEGDGLRSVVFNVVSFASDNNGWEQRDSPEHPDPRCSMDQAVQPL